MSLLLGLFGDVTSTLKVIVAMCVVIGLIFLLIKIKELRPILAVIFVIVFAFAGVFALYHDIVYLSTNHITVGDIVNSYLDATKNKTQVKEDKAEWELENLGFSLVKNNTYESTIILDPCKCLDLKNNTYTLFVNNDRCLANDIGKDYVRSNYKYTFYDVDKTIIATDTLSINFAFTKNETKLVLKTEGGLNAVKLWKAYQAKNNFVLSIKETSKVDYAFDSINKIDGKYAKYDFENGNLKGFTVDINTTYETKFILPKTIAGELVTTISTNALKGLNTNEIYFDGTSTEFISIAKEIDWNKTIEDQYINKINCTDFVLTLNKNGNLVFDETQNFVYVTFYVDDEIYKTIIIGKKTSISISIEEPTTTKQNMIFAGWYYNDNLIDIANYSFSENSELYAKFEKLPLPEGTYEITLTHQYDSFNGMNFTTYTTDINFTIEIKNNLVSLLNGKGEIFNYNSYCTYKKDENGNYIYDENYEYIVDKIIEVPRAFGYRFDNNGHTCEILIGYNTQLSDNLDSKYVEGWQCETSITSGVNNFVIKTI